MVPIVYPVLHALILLVSTSSRRTRPRRRRNGPFDEVLHHSLRHAYAFIDGPV